MKCYIITTSSSVTAAVSQTLTQSGVPNDIVATPRKYAGNGCSYAVSFVKDYRARVTNILNKTKSINQIVQIICEN